jgi:hypothetical protein
VPVAADRLPPRGARVAGDERPAEDIAVPGEVLRRRVHDDVGAERERLRVHGRRAGGVDGDERAGGVRVRRDPGDVGDGPRRVRGRLEPHEARGARAQRGSDGVRVGRVDDRHADAELGAEPLGPVAERVVPDCRNDDVIARAAQRAEHRRRGRHARREHERVGAALELRERSLGGLGRRVPVARVVAPTDERVVGVARVRGRELDRRHERAGAIVDGKPAARRDRGGGERRILVGHRRRL